jgi:hypothetical protein
MSNEEQNGFFAKPVLGAVRVRMMDYMVHFKTDAHIATNAKTEAVLMAFVDRYATVLMSH